MQIVRNPLIYVVPALLVALVAEFGMAQSNENSTAPRSRYRFVDSTPKPLSETVQEKEITPEMPQRLEEVNQAQPMVVYRPQFEGSDAPASPTRDAAAPVIKTTYQSPQYAEGEMIAGQQVSGRPVRHVMESKQQIQSDYDEARAQYERMQYEKSLAQPFDANQVRTIPEDVYKVFPLGSDLQGYSTSLFLSEQGCCDEWAGMCRMKKLNYKCGGCGLKANPGHYGQPWLRGCDNCETTCGTKLRGGKGISARCGKSCLNKAMERANGRINRRADCGCKACMTLDRTAQGCSGCAAAAPAPAPVVQSPSPAACDCAECQKASRPTVARNVNMSESQVSTSQVAKGFSNLKEALTSKAASTARKMNSKGSSRTNWDELVR